jgi:hypothetical protein
MLAGHEPFMKNLVKRLQSEEVRIARVGLREYPGEESRRAVFTCRVGLLRLCRRFKRTRSR